MLAACDDSLRRLGTDFIDLYQIHRWDEETPVEETMEALDEPRARGQGALPGRQQHGGVAVRASACTWPTRQRLAPVRVHAEPLQPGLSRGRARDDPALRARGPGPHALEPAGPRLPRGLALARGRSSRTARAQNDEFADNLYFREADFARARRGARRREGAWRERRAGGPRLAPRPARGSMRRSWGPRSSAISPTP